MQLDTATLVIFFEIETQSFAFVALLLSQKHDIVELANLKARHP